ncbi:MAG: copper chaperone PCu(A)C [Pseudomonadota bacterium]
MKLAFSILAALSLSTAAVAHEYKAGGLDIDHPMTFETGAKVGGGYMTITNSGDTDDVLIEVKADFPRVEIHETVEEDGVAKMNHVGRIDIPAGETVKLKPGGLHVMFMGLEDPLAEGDKIPATLIFENAGEVEVTFNVEAHTGDHSGHDHSGHDHSN